MSERQQTIISRMFFEVCGACQNNCAECQHKEMRRRYPDYQLDIPSLMRFIDVTRESNYEIRNLLINGIGEPLMWQHFNEGVRLLHASGVVLKIHLYTNGQAIETIEPETWKCIESVHVNAYTSIHKDRNTPESLLKAGYQWGDKIKAYWVGGFRKSVIDRHPETLPCLCESPGPMYCDGRIWPWCGPVLFDACAIAGTVPMAHSVPCEVGYVDMYSERMQGTFGECDCCNANSTLLKAAAGVDHAQEK